MAFEETIFFLAAFFIHRVFVYVYLIHFLKNRMCCFYKKQNLHDQKRYAYFGKSKVALELTIFILAAALVQWILTSKICESPFGSICLRSKFCDFVVLFAEIQKNLSSTTITKVSRCNNQYNPTSKPQTVVFFHHDVNVLQKKFSHNFKQFFAKKLIQKNIEISDGKQRQCNHKLRRSLC